MLVFQNYAKTYARTIALHTAGAREIWIDQSRFSRREKLYFPNVNVSRLTEKALKSGYFLTGDGINYSRKQIYNSNAIQDCKKCKL